MGHKKMVLLIVADNKAIRAINAFWQLARVPEDTIRCRIKLSRCIFF